MKIYVHLQYYLTEFFTEQEILKKKLVEKIKTHILCSNFFQKLCCVCRSGVWGWQVGRLPQALLFRLQTSTIRVRLKLSKLLFLICVFMLL